MNKTVLRMVLAVLFLLNAGTATLLCAQTEEKGKEAAGDILRIKEAADWDGAMAACAEAIDRCRSYVEYEKLSDEIKKLIEKQKGYKYPDVLRYAYAKARVKELSNLAEKNDIDAGRIYMSVNEKYYNEALASLDEAAKLTSSRDLAIDAYFLKFLIFKELFQHEKMDSVFNEMIDAIKDYSPDINQSIAKLSDVSQRLTDSGLADYAMKLRLLFAAKAGPDSARAIADSIRSGADKYFDEGRVKEAAGTYDTYLELAGNCYDKETIAAKVADIAEKYFNKARYKEAIKYYSMYLFKYSDLPLADYCGYKLALSLYQNKDYAESMAKFEEFLSKYPNSVWFEKGFENLSNLYYEFLPLDKALEKEQALINAYPRRDTCDHAHLLMAALYYSSADYDKALEVLKKLQTDFPKSAYLYAAGLLIEDIEDVKKGELPYYSFGSKELYKVWEPYTPVSADISAGEGAQPFQPEDAKAGEVYVKAKAGSRVTFNINNIEDLDRFSEFEQDTEDQSRLPKKIRDQTEKDLMFFTWSSPDGGKFADDKQTLSKSWQAPDEPGAYTVTLNAGDLALVRMPDSGIRKDPAKTLTIRVSVEK